MRKLSKKSLCLAAAALTLTAGISAGTAMAYFTTYAEASGNEYGIYGDNAYRGIQ